MLNQLRRDVAAGLGVAMMVGIFMEVQELKGQSGLLTFVVLAATLMIGMAVCFTVHTEEV
jgi:hypothetical protein